MSNARHIWRNARLATMIDGAFGIVEDGMVVAVHGRIAYAGPASDAPGLDDAPETSVTDCGGRLVTPGLIDAHTHLVYAGNRAREFEMRLNGASYSDIAASGGGIVSTVAAVRAADEEALLNESLPRLDALMREGVTTLEIKSGYGLAADQEAKMLRVAGRMAERRAVRVRRTFLGAHAIPPAFDGDADAYIADVCVSQLPLCAPLADAVDGFCEQIAFSAPQIERVFDAAQALELPIKLHAEQLSNTGGTRLAARYGALSADHLEYADEGDIIAMAEAGTIAMILPGAFYYLGETRKPPIELMRRHGVPMAVATDANPGSSPMTSILLAMNMSAVLFGMTPEECLAGTTINAAHALGLSTTCGTLEAGKACDLAVWSVDHPSELVYAIGSNPLYARVFGGFTDVSMLRGDAP